MLIIRSASAPEFRSDARNPQHQTEDSSADDLARRKHDLYSCTASLVERRMEAAASLLKG
jgi:hypothetical protein